LHMGDGTEVRKVLHPIRKNKILSGAKYLSVVIRFA
jgi:hypothetical protein